MENTSSPLMVVQPVHWYDISFTLPRRKAHSPQTKPAFEWKRWWKTRLLRPSFRIRFMFPTVRISRVRFIQSKSEALHMSVCADPADMDEARKEFERHLRQVQFRNRYLPQFRIKLQFPLRRGTLFAAGLSGAFLLGIAASFLLS